MKDLELKVATTTISYHGEQVYKILNAHQDVVQAIGSYCYPLIDATIKVHAETHEDIWPLAWHLDVSSPSGRRSLTISQRTENAKVSFTRQ